MRFPRILILVALASVPAGCQSTMFDGLSAPAGGPMQYRCTDGVKLTLERSAGSVTASDSRGFNAEMPASPPAQTTRYAEGIYALILEDVRATWFVSGQKPVECRR